jgi:LPS O-antigen subunit length determinant protein (WzzB/FepE family)
VKTFQTLINETLEAENLEELEAAADLFEFGVEKGYYNKRQASEFNNTYWKTKNKCLAYEIADDIKANTLDIITIVSNAPSEIKENKQELINYVNGRIKALKGKIKGLK